MQMDPAIRARRKALREAQSWLMARAKEMNDPKARDILHSAAFAFGQEKLLGFDPKTGKAGHHLKNTGSSQPAPDPPQGPAQSQTPED